MASVAMITPLAEASASGRLVGMAGTAAALPEGADVIYANPAFLGMARDRSQWALRITGATAQVGNNSWSQKDYDRYFETELTDADRESLLRPVPDGGLRARAVAHAQALGLRSGPFALGIDAIAAGDLNADRLAVDLLLRGNRNALTDIVLDRTSEGLVAWRIRLACGRSIGAWHGRPVYVGVATGPVWGRYYGRTAPIRMTLSAPGAALFGSGRTSALTSKGGFGWGLDIGMVHQLPAGWVGSVWIENLWHTIRWKTRNARHEFGFSLNGVHVNRLDEFDAAFDESDAGQQKSPSGAFSRGLPPQLSIGLGRSSKRLALNATSVLALRDRLGMSTTPSVGVGVETRAVPFLPFRAGLAVGGGYGWRFGTGFGIWLGPLRLDVGVMTDRALWYSSARGITAAVSLDWVS